MFSLKTNLHPNSSYEKIEPLAKAFDIMKPVNDDFDSFGNRLDKLLFAYFQIVTYQNPYKNFEDLAPNLVGDAIDHLKLFDDPIVAQVAGATICSSFYVNNGLKLSPRILEELKIELVNSLTYRYERWNQLGEIERLNVSDDIRNLTIGISEIWMHITRSVEHTLMQNWMIEHELQDPLSKLLWAKKQPCNIKLSDAFHEESLIPVQLKTFLEEVNTWRETFISEIIDQLCD